MIADVDPLPCLVAEEPDGALVSDPLESRRNPGAQLRRLERPLVVRAVEPGDGRAPFRTDGADLLEELGRTFPVHLAAIGARDGMVR